MFVIVHTLYNDHHIRTNEHIHPLYIVTICVSVCLCVLHPYLLIVSAETFH